MMPNVFQYPVAVAAVLPRGLCGGQHQPAHAARAGAPAQDSGTKAIIIFENFASVLQQVIANVPTKHVILTAMGDVLGLLKGPSSALWWQRQEGWCRPRCQGRALQRRAVARTRHELSRAAAHANVAVLQYTGGTTGVSKGAVLLHPQPGSQSAAVQGLVASRRSEGAAGRADRHDLCAAAVSHLRFQHEHDAVAAHGRRQCLDSQSAGPAGALQRSCGTPIPQLPWQSTRCSWPWPTIPSSRPWTGAPS